MGRDTVPRSANAPVLTVSNVMPYGHVRRGFAENRLWMSGRSQQAIVVAAKEAKLGPTLRWPRFPKPKGLVEQLSEALHGQERPLARNDLAGRLTWKVMQEWRWLSGFNDPQGIYMLLPFDLELN